MSTNVLDARVRRLSIPGILIFSLAAALILGAMIWQAIVASGAPNPTAHGLDPASAVLSSGILVFREGLEAILVLAAVTAGLGRYRANYWGPVLLGVGLAFGATVATWFVAIAILSAVNLPELQLQAATGLLAVVVLLVVMNWFFHKLYWTGWICHHCKRRKNIFDDENKTTTRILLGLALLGFTATYREGFEIVLFLQDLRLKAGSGIVLGGASVGLALTAIVAGLTFVAHRRLSYKKMLIFTGVLLAGVLVVMVGESMQEMQLAGWVSSHPISLAIPDWMGVWFATFPNFEGLGSQVVAAALIFGSYAWVRRQVPKAANGQPVTPGCEV